jgi:type IV pilus assembly protein PilO
MRVFDLVERYSKFPPLTRVGIIFGVSLLCGAIYYFMFYSDLASKAKRLSSEVTNLRAQKAKLEEKKANYERFRAEVNRLLEEQKELLKQLPTEAEIPAFLQSIHAQAELAGLNITIFVQKAEVRKSFYARIPVKMSITGAYHQISKFFNAIGGLKRIVTVQNLSLGAPRATDFGVRLKASFVASTYRFLAPGEKGGKKKKRRRRGRRRKRG